MSAKQEKFLEQVKEWPTGPGIYMMKDAAGRVLYVGKAKNIRARIRSYFQQSGQIALKTKALVAKTVQLDFTVTHNELEAILLECNLIKKHRPRYNVRLKDDKNFPYFVLDYGHRFPQFRITRKVKPRLNLRYFGPYSAGVNELSRFLLKTFQIRDCSEAKFRNRDRPCLNYEIGTCSAPCVDYVTSQEYSVQVEEAVLFLKGESDALLERLEAEMNAASEAMKYEQAKIYRDKIQSLRKISEKQTAVLAERERDVDVIGHYQSEAEIQWVILYVRGGFLTGKRAYKTKIGLSDFPETASSFLSQVYLKALVPDEIWLSEKIPDGKQLEELLKQQSEKRVRIRRAASAEELKLADLASENAKLIYKEAQNAKQDSNGVEELREVLKLSDPPLSLEGIDISNLQEEAPVGSLVHFEDGTPLKSRYRLYYPKTVEGQNDFAMIYEVVRRRLSDKENPPPDLLMIDGGKGQLGAALKALEDLDLELPICSLAKSKTQRGFTRKDVEKTEERIFIPGRKNPIVLAEGHPALRLLQRLRDEAHRFGVRGHRRRRDNNKLKSILLEVKGIGPKSRDKLLKRFGSPEAMAEAPISELETAGLSGPVVDELLQLLRGKNQ